MTTIGTTRTTSRTACDPATSVTKSLLGYGVLAARRAGGVESRSLMRQLAALRSMSAAAAPR